MSQPNFRPDASEKPPLATLSVAALGVVFGDIGTSPLYTMKEVFSGNHPLGITPESVLGILSLLFWSLTLVVSVKYVVFVMRVDNRGEGGIMAMLSLVHRALAERPRLAAAMLPLGLFGAALFYGDGMITPAISVLSAVEGLEVGTPAFTPWVDPLALVVLTALFMLQRKGSAHVGKLFGPVMVIWFATLGSLGVLNILRQPDVLAAFNPLYALHFFAHHGSYGFLVLGGVVLAVTGGEALYADMGHFGRKPIRLAWFLFVMPALLLNYFGQGALLLADPKSLENPFYLMAPGWTLFPLVILATLATIIASQAVISGAFSMTHQATQLGYLPRMQIRHTSERQIGQIYIPFINWLLLAGVVALVLGFRDSNSLGAAYGMAVTGTMTITTILGFIVVSMLWRWNRVLTVAGLLVFLAVDLAFFAANLVKVADGGWFPLASGAVIFVLLATWKRGRELLAARTQSESIPLDPFLKRLEQDPPLRVPGTAVFLSPHPGIVPRSLMHNLAHNKVLHERNVFVTVVTEDVPFVPVSARTDVREVCPGCFSLVVHYGFMQIPNIPRALSRCQLCGSRFNMQETSFFLNRETLLPSRTPGMPLWREALFAWMSRNAQSPMGFFQIPSNRVIELGTQVRL
jgi:KUP system potassium uptake protein